VYIVTIRIQFVHYVYDTLIATVQGMQRSVCRSLIRKTLLVPTFIIIVDVTRFHNIVYVRMCSISITNFIILFMYICVPSPYQISSFSLGTAIKQEAEDSFALLLSFCFTFYKNVFQRKVARFSVVCYFSLFWRLHVGSVKEDCAIFFF
jgi:hypothetical protein